MKIPASILLVLFFSSHLAIAQPFAYIANENDNADYHQNLTHLD